MKIKNKDIEKLYLLIKDLKLNARESRYRLRLNNILLEHLQKTYIPERIETINHFALKDEKGNVVNDNGNYTIPPENVAEFSIEINNVDNELFIIETNESNKDMLLSVYNILTGDIIEIDGEFAEAHDDACVELEKVIELYNSSQNNT